MNFDYMVFEYIGRVAINWLNLHDNFMTQFSWQLTPRGVGCLNRGRFYSLPCSSGGSLTQPHSLSCAIICNHAWRCRILFNGGNDRHLSTVHEHNKKEWSRNELLLLHTNASCDLLRGDCLKFQHIFAIQNLFLEMRLDFGRLIACSK